MSASSAITVKPVKSASPTQKKRKMETEAMSKSTKKARGKRRAKSPSPLPNEDERPTPPLPQEPPVLKRANAMYFHWVLMCLCIVANQTTTSTGPSQPPQEEAKLPPKKKPSKPKAPVDPVRAAKVKNAQALLTQALFTLTLPDQHERASALYSEFASFCWEHALKLTVS